MSEEIVYANLKFQDSNKKEHTQRSEKGGAEVPSAPSHSQDKAVLSLTLLCLLLLVGLGVLGGLFYTTLETVIIKSNELQDIKEELQRNVSLQLTHNHNSSKKIRHLSSLLQKLATQLCRELYRKEPEHKCKPCPKGSKWHKDSCYFKLSRLGTWQNSEMLCSTQNASLLKLKNKSVLDHLPRTLPSEMGPSTSNVIHEDAPQTSLLDNLMKAFSQLRFPSQMTQASVKMTKQTNKPNQHNVEHFHVRRHQ
ncbi:C-type lectin domain family 12 member A isoform X2 [Mesocricetus auratus]|uniref:C-type lectin domain family 12 member A isoform X2 n=1 Tax=Mesocricetus auratus TaxID=10036 RepID=A0ABM2X9Z5_MESAU|nr:C-type lectin domain family 12 member A isoform X2 [Mesocricetus auratus]